MDIESRLRRCLPLNRLPQGLQNKAVALATLRHYARGETVYLQDASDDRVHYLVAGGVELVWHGRVTRTLSAAHQAALGALDPPGRKRYTVRADQPTTIASFRRIELDRLSEQAERERTTSELEVSEITSARSSDWMIRLLQSELFAALPARNIQQIFARMESLTQHAGDVIVVQGSPGDYYYVIESGYCEVARTIAGGRGQVQLAELGPGAAFGEEALIAGRPRNASVTMLTEGRLMRLARTDFIELILREVLHPLDLAAAIAAVDDGAVWLDVRYPEDRGSGSFAGAENIPVNMLRLHCNRLRKDFHYVLCGDDAEHTAIAAFLLAERGFDVAYLDLGIATALAQEPALLEPAARQPSATVIYLPGSAAGHDAADATIVTPGDNDQTGMAAGSDDSPLDNTITRIAGLYTHAEAARKMNDTLEPDKYADTASGRALADIIEELTEQHDALEDRGAAVEATGHDLDLDLSRSQTAADTAFPGSLLAEFGARIQAEVERQVQTRASTIEAGYRDKLKRMRALTNAEIRHREAAIRRTVARENDDKEQLLRSYYKKLMALANSISRQKAQLVEARRQFEHKLASADQLYRDIEDMRRMLDEQISYLDQQPIEEPPRLSLSL
ncbi:MAG: cyclic nucleotide-binding domain-containing protein [Gammaproteobacteria bacterium]